MTFPCVKLTNTKKSYSHVSNMQIQKYKYKIHKYTNIAYDEVPKRPNMWYIFEMRIVQGYQKWYSQVSNAQMQKIHIQKYTNTAYDEVDSFRIYGIHRCWLIAPLLNFIIWQCKQCLNRLNNVLTDLTLNRPITDQTFAMSHKGLFSLFSSWLLLWEEDWGGLQRKKSECRLEILIIKDHPY